MSPLEEKGRTTFHANTLPSSTCNRIRKRLTLVDGTLHEGAQRASSLLKLLATPAGLEINSLSQCHLTPPSAGSAFGQHVIIPPDKIHAIRVNHGSLPPIYQSSWGTIPCRESREQKVTRQTSIIGMSSLAIQLKPSTSHSNFMSGHFYVIWLISRLGHGRWSRGCY